MDEKEFEQALLNVIISSKKDKSAELIIREVYDLYYHRQDRLYSPESAV